jgi:hypothetical protein
VKRGTRITVTARGSLLGEDTFTGVFLGRNRMVTRIREDRVGAMDIYNDDILTLEVTA